MSYASVTKSVVAQFIKKEIICRYRLTERIIFDNGLNLYNDMVNKKSRDECDFGSIKGDKRKKGGLFSCFFAVC